HTPTFEIHLWIKGPALSWWGSGTWAGGWRIIRTLGHKPIKMRPIHGFAAEATGATILLVAGNLGMPVSTTHAITTSIIGVGLAKSGGIDTVTAERIVWAWIFTIPCTMGLAWACFHLFKLVLG